MTLSFAKIVYKNAMALSNDLRKGAIPKHLQKSEGHPDGRQDPVV